MCQLCLDFTATRCCYGRPMCCYFSSDFPPCQKYSVSLRSIEYCLFLQQIQIFHRREFATASSVFISKCGYKESKKFELLCLLFCKKCFRGVNSKHAELVQIIIRSSFSSLCSGYWRLDCVSSPNFS